MFFFKTKKEAHVYIYMYSFFETVLNGNTMKVIRGVTLHNGGKTLCPVVMYCFASLTIM